MTAEPVAVRVPRENVNDETVKLVRWHFAEGAAVEKNAVVAEVETSKSVLEIPAPAAGWLRRRAEEGAQVPVGGLLCYISVNADDPLPAAPAPQAAAASGGPLFSEKAKQVMERHGLSPEKFAGKKLVRESDVLAALGLGAAVDVKPLSEQKRAENRYLAGDNNRYASAVAVLCRTKGLRAAARKQAAWGGSLTPVILFECARLLRDFPVFNARYEDEGIHEYPFVNVGLVIDDGRGIRVPVVREADKKEIPAIAREVQDYALEYHEDSLPAKSLQDGTFTVTDLSGEDVFSFLPVINHGQSAILGVGAEYEVGGDRLFQLNLTFDHRLSEGREAARFLRALRERLAAHEDA
ncbi:MAG: 2-oxo acid dehydrogenase subunit E2 [Elusimicrobiota bacterium]